MAASIVAGDRAQLVRDLFPRGGIVVEVGVQRGHFANVILEACEPAALFLVDHWQHDPTSNDPENFSQQVKDQEYMACADMVGKDPRVAMLRMTSDRAGDLFAQESLDAVYLDADHRASGIALDISVWWRRVRRGGILAGHDYCSRRWIAVQAIVDNFVAMYGLDLMLSAEPDFPSWAVRKP